MSRAARFLAFALAGGLAVVTPANAQTTGMSGRFSLFGQNASQRSGNLTSSSREFVSMLTLRSMTAEEGGFEYALDGRVATYPAGEREDRYSLYEAWVGARSKRGTWGFRLGQLWLDELGGLGSLGGLLLEYRQPQASALGRFRAAVFAGLEPEPYDVAYVPDVTKGGLYLALEGAHGRRHTLGYVQVRHADLLERSVTTLGNFIPIGTKFFLYQWAEYDLQGPLGNGGGGLTYLVVNARYAPVRALELQANYHHGRSIDVRTIADDILNGRPVSPAALEGLLFESAGGRVTVIPARWLRLWAGYAQDRSDRDEAPSSRTVFGASTTNLFDAGLDITVSDSKIDRSTGSYDSWYVSVGKTLGSRAYLSADYSTSLSVVRLENGGVVIESHPRTRRYTLSSTVTITRAISLYVTGERLEAEDDTEDRILTGIAVRF